jgi:WD40 repeat protein
VSSVVFIEYLEGEMADLQPGKASLIWELPFEGAWPTSVAFLGNQRIAAGNQEGQLFLWDLPDKPAKGQPPPSPTRRLAGHENGITRLIGCGDGKTLLSASLDHSVRIWDTSGPTSGTEEVILDADTRAREAKRGRKEAVKKPGVQVEVQTAHRVLAGHDDWIKSLGLSDDGRRVISGDDSAWVIVWDLASGKEVKRWRGLPWNWIVGAALSADGQTAAVSEFRYKRDDFDIPAAALRLWKVEEGTVQLDFLKEQFPKYKPNDTSYGAAQVWRKFVADGLLAPAFSPDGKLLAVGQGGETGVGKVHLLDTTTGKLVRSVSGHRYGVTDLLFSASGKHLLSVGRDTTVRICQVADGKEVAQVGKPRGGQFKDWLSALSLSPDQCWLAAADIAGKVAVWRLGS